MLLCALLLELLCAVPPRVTQTTTAVKQGTRTGRHDMMTPHAASVLLGFPEGGTPDFRMPDEVTISRFQSSRASSNDDAVDPPLRLLWTHIFRAPAVFATLSRSALPTGSFHSATLPVPLQRLAVNEAGQVVETAQEDGSSNASEAPHEPAMLVLSSMPEPLPPSDDRSADAIQQRGAARPVAVGRMGESLYAMPIGSSKARSRRQVSYVPRGKRGLRGERGLEGVASGGTQSVVVMGAGRERHHSDGFMCPIGALPLGFACTVCIISGCCSKTLKMLHLMAMCAASHPLVARFGLIDGLPSIFCWLLMLRLGAGDCNLNKLC
jgi:hypothetical protein